MVKKIEDAIQHELPRCTVAGVLPYVEVKARPFGRRARRRR
jgi:hypothetical protein